MKIELAVLFGGRSVEHEVSVISALQAIENLNKEKYNIHPVYIAKTGEMYTGEVLRSMSSYLDIPGMLETCRQVTFVPADGNVYLQPISGAGRREKPERIDVAFPITHGTNVEDGALQGYLKTVGVPFVGPDVLASAVGMDKYVMKTILRDGGFPVLDCVRFLRGDRMEDMVRRVEDKMAYPVIVKPVNLGSSVGISKASDREALEAALETAFTYADTVLTEPAITKLREINCSVVGDAWEAQASECEEPFMEDEILSYENKYMDRGGAKGGGAKGMASLKRKIPADISPELRERIRTMAVDAFRYLGMSGVSRIDFMIDCEADALYINEFNTIPGSLAFYLWEPVGVPYTELLDTLISLAIKRSRQEEDILFSFDTNLLALSTHSGTKGAKSGKKV
ncbi:MAG: D-alanine--D-alanine ligase [Clostridiales bacterium]|nr:D-alanine--D-alanine ligase [Clostridiales bacterium]